jgi:hypothetical protein
VESRLNNWREVLSQMRATISDRMPPSQATPKVQLQDTKQSDAEEQQRLQQHKHTGHKRHNTQTVTAIGRFFTMFSPCMR